MLTFLTVHTVFAYFNLYGVQLFHSMWVQVMIESFVNDTERHIKLCFEYACEL